MEEIASEMSNAGQVQGNMLLVSEREISRVALVGPDLGSNSRLTEADGS